MREGCIKFRNIWNPIYKRSRHSLVSFFLKMWPREEVPRVSDPVTCLQRNERESHTVYIKVWGAYAVFVNI